PSSTSTKIFPLRSSISRIRRSLLSDIFDKNFSKNFFFSFKRSQRSISSRIACCARTLRSLNPRISRIQCLVYTFLDIELLSSSLLNDDSTLLLFIFIFTPVDTKNIILVCFIKSKYLEFIVMSITGIDDPDCKVG
ncbi:hypothetical protein DERP_005333, partial [Dermatophagoides pteronyssinus]